MANTPNPMVLAGTKRREDVMKRRGRAFGLGERNPKTLPGSGTDAESEEQNRNRQAAWSRLGKLSRGVKWTGHKYL